MKNIKRQILVAIMVISTVTTVSTVSAYAVSKDGQSNNNEISTDSADLESSSNAVLSDSSDKNTDTDEKKSYEGWTTIDGNTYYYDSDNKKSMGWTEIEHKWYYFNTDGRLLKGWLHIENKWYYCNNTGIRVSGWLNDNGKKYYLDKDGIMVSGFNKIGDNTYYFNDSGDMVTGWTTIDSQEYYFNKSGALRCGWIGVGKNIYYTDTKGAKVTNATINGYKLDEEGKLVLAANETEPDIDLYFTNKNIVINTDDCDYKSKNKGIQESVFKGIDISNHNGYVDFNAVKQSGVKAVYMKASESDYFIDQYAAVNSANAKSVGLKVGYYHYLTGTSSPEAQARLFYECIKDKPNDLKPCVDVEVSGSTAADYTVRFINEFKKYSNMDVCIYTYSNFINYLDSRLAPYTLWEANYNGSPFSLPSNGIWSSKAGHQYSGSGSLSGVNGDVDLNVFTHDILL